MLKCISWYGKNVHKLDYLRYYFRSVLTEGYRPKFSKDILASCWVVLITARTGSFFFLLLLIGTLLRLRKIVYRKLVQDDNKLLSGWWVSVKMRRQRKTMDKKLTALAMEKTSLH